MNIIAKHRQLVTPGDLVAEGKFRAGQNVIKLNGDRFYATVLGSFEIKDRDTLSVRALRGPYIPRRGDKVIGKVVDISMGSWTVDIRAPYEATLPAGRFPARINPVFDDIRKFMGADDFVYAEIAEFDRARPPILDATLNREYGLIRQGVVIEVEPTRVPRIIGKKGSMIQLLNRELGSQITVGQNGRVWVRAPSPEAVSNTVSTIRLIEAEAHTQGLTSRVEERLKTLKNASQKVATENKE